MATLKFDLITPERVVFSEEVDAIIAPGSEGQLGILPHHLPLMTMLKPGEVLARKGQGEFYFAVSGGFLNVQPNKVTILADAAERAEEIDTKRAEEARHHAQEEIKQQPYDINATLAEARLLRSLARLKVGRRSRKR